jgi:capsular exopolysaccharide synthesis family protein
MAQNEYDVYKRQLLIHKKIKSPVAEAYRALRTNLQYIKIKTGPIKKILFTSTEMGEGKSTIVANTAVALAQNGKKVLVLDCDFHKPVQHLIFHRENQGITNYLIQKLPPAGWIQNTEVPNLNLLASGPEPPNPSELLGSLKMAELIEILQTDYDYLLFDSPPALVFTDPCVLAANTDGVILVIAAGKTHLGDIRSVKELFAKIDCNILGVILNQVEASKKEYMYYNYYRFGEKNA